MTTPSGNAAGTGFAALDVQMAVALGMGQEWANHSRAVDEGRLTFNPDMKKGAVAALNEAIGHLRDAQYELSNVGDVQGLGSYPSGIALAAKFNKKFAEGFGVLDAHIAVLEQMIDTIEAAAAAYSATEAANTSSYGGPS